MQLENLVTKAELTALINSQDISILRRLIDRELANLRSSLSSLALSEHQQSRILAEINACEKVYSLPERTLAELLEDTESKTKLKNFNS